MSGVRTIRVINAVEVKSGTNDRGGDWHLYEISATTPEGEPIDLKLKSFDKLAGDVEVEVERQEHEKYGVSYMLKRKGAGSGGSGSPGARLGPKVDELRTRVEALEQIATTLVDDVAFIRTLVGDPPQQSLSSATPHNAVFGDDDDVPF